MKVSLKFISRSILVLAFVMFVACAGSKETIEQPSPESEQSDSFSEIEQLLGLTPGEQASTPQDTEQTGFSTETQPMESAMNEPSQEVVQLQSQIEELQAQLQQKDQQIADLKMQLAMLQEELEKAQTSQTTAVEFSSAGGGTISDVEYEQRYQAALSLFNKRQYRAAIEQFEALVAANPNHSLADNAQYWIGECYYLLGDYRAAILAFEKVFTFKNSNKNEDAQYKLGLCYYNLKDRERARQEFQTFIDNYKNSKLIRKAEEYLARL